MDDLSLSTLANAPRAIARRYERNFGGRVYEWYFERNPEHDATSAIDAAVTLRNADHALFLCLGNICRSPFAEEYARNRFSSSKLDVTVSSAGLSPYEGIESPANAISIAERFGVDLRSHRSSRVTSTDLRRSDVVFVMDFANYYLLATRYSGETEKAYFLGAIADDEPAIAIPDPHGRSQTQFFESYWAIATAIDQLSGRESNSREGTASIPES